jgi:hypothetical protein
MSRASRAADFAVARLGTSSMTHFPISRPARQS